MSHNDWQVSKYLFFLTTFLIPRDINKLPIMNAAEWKILLGEEPLVVTEKLEKDGLLIRSNLAVHLDYKYANDELKEMLEQKKLTTVGKKIELILRLIDSDLENMWSMCSDVKIFECTEVGTKMVYEYFLQNANNPELTFHELNISPDKTNEWVKWAKWVLAAAIGGIIGNRADDALLCFIQKTINVFPFSNDKKVKCQDIVLVIDRSWSMQGSILDNTKFAVRTLIETVGKKGRVSVVTFSNTAVVNQRLTNNVESLKTAIDNINATTGGSNIALALVYAANELQSIRGRIDCEKLVILLTDGKLTDDLPYSILESANRIKKNNITLAAVALGHEADHEFLRAVVSNSAEFYTSTDASNLLEILHSIIGE